MDAALLGVSDASIVNGNGTHSWVLLTGESEHLDNPYMEVEGTEPVDSYPIDMSSTWGELQSSMSLAIMSKIILTQNNASEINVVLLSDNKGM